MHNLKDIQDLTLEDKIEVLDVAITKDLKLKNIQRK